MTQPIILAAGGTGGHIFPAEALAELLRARGHAVAMVTDARFANYISNGSNATLAQVPLYYVNAGTLNGNWLHKALGVAKIFFSIMQARALLRQLKPRCVVGFGGYPSFPTVMAATMLGIPTVIHEQNSVLGRANRVLSRRVKRIATTYADTQEVLPDCKAKVVQVGNPVRAAVRQLREAAYEAPHEQGELRVLITGGSQGATVFSQVVPEALKLLPEAQRARLVLVQQCRAADMDAVRAAYDALHINAELAPFFANLPQRLAAAHLVIGRSGASTVAELSCAGRPAILVPYPAATDDHQFYNATAIADAGAGWVMRQEHFTPEALADKVQMLLAAPSLLMQAAEAMRALGLPDATEALAKVVLDAA